MDGLHDLAVSGSQEQPPSWSDLSRVAWNRDADGARVAFTVSGPLSLTGAGTATFTTMIREGRNEARVDARLRDGHWRVTSSGKGRTTKLKAEPVVQDGGGTVDIELPLRLPIGGGSVDLRKRVDVSASAETEVSGTVFRDRDCSVSRSGGTRHYVTWPKSTRTPTPGTTVTRHSTVKPSYGTIRPSYGTRPSSGTGSSGYKPTMPRSRR